MNDYDIIYAADYDSDASDASVTPRLPISHAIYRQFTPGYIRDRHHIIDLVNPPFQQQQQPVVHPSRGGDPSSPTATAPRFEADLAYDSFDDGYFDDGFVVLPAAVTADQTVLLASDRTGAATLLSLIKQSDVGHPFPADSAVSVTAHRRAQGNLMAEALRDERHPALVQFYRDGYEQLRCEYSVRPAGLTASTGSGGGGNPGINRNAWRRWKEANGTVMALVYLDPLHNEPHRQLLEALLPCFSHVIASEQLRP
ncbi:hypothetical protein IWQ60_009584 [Tieghemiomyces parasiticus]|uniref:Uncharacterized protein n=1 Tax=Tieghemiomyces parasiticus TaxID=78921 RepID=A0A9W7ZTI8_9FUNG|nr:hypothetical protein IWQ60_009584 [Tieghemiomyces parasiticus]